VPLGDDAFLASPKWSDVRLLREIRIRSDFALGLRPPGWWTTPDGDSALQTRLFRTNRAAAALAGRHAYCDAAELMNSAPADTQHTADDQRSSTQANGSSNGKPREFARRTIATLSTLPSSLDAQMKGRPYAAFGVALAIGVGTGILLRSRILRSVIASAASYAVIELGRAYLRETKAATRAADK
jgi:ElaB/YqjD/DUF883 family membrane-anchored ribosome-binding protein